MRQLLMLLLLAAAVLFPAPAMALGAVTEVSFRAEVQPDGSVLVTDRRVIPDPRPVEFLEFLIPQGGSVELIGVADQRGPLPQVADTATGTRGFRSELSQQVLYVEWADPAPAAPLEITFTYKLTHALILHQDAVEFYYPVITGSGGRGVARLNATLTLPARGPAMLYAYGGEAGGVRVSEAPYQVSAVNIAENDTFEWRLLADRSVVPGAQGQQGASGWEALRQAEEKRIAGQMSKANRLWIAHLLLALAPFFLAGAYFTTVRRSAPEPAPDSLTPEQLMAVSPAVVGWVYDSDWFDFANAQLMNLERRGAVNWEVQVNDLDLQIRRLPGAILSEADEALLALYRVDEEPRFVSRIGENWESNSAAFKRDRDAWLKLVEAEVPPEWLSHPSVLVAGVPAAIYLVGGAVSGGVGEWLALWAVAALLGFMAYKRRWLSPVGESYIARWTSAYFAAVSRSHEAVPRVDPEYLLAVEVGDEHLEKLMGRERYRVVKGLYTHLE
ncbi:MAG TPA: hypothetical protein VD902_06510 [Symbiobacteriaceae bacterium]|nr:hypothetical protein [Symbiobacteriaceae bacterium]